MFIDNGYPNRQLGLSLVEFMVAGVVGLILTTGLVQIFVSNKKTFDTTEASAYVQETGRIATDFLAYAVRNADYWGCSDMSNVHNNVNVSVTDDILGFGEGVQGADDNADTSDAIIDGTDSLTLRGTGGGTGVQITSPMPNSSAVLNVNSNSRFDEGDVILLTNCQGGDIFQITNLPGAGKVGHATGGNVSPGNGKNTGTCAGGSSGANCLSQIYDTGASVMIPYSQTYYIGTGTGGEPALFLKDGAMGGTNVGGSDDIEIVQGVEDMQILYGEDTDNDGNADVYREADQVSDMGSVLSIRISLLVRSAEDNVLETAQNITFNGTAVDGSDRRLRRIYTMTSAIRNRL